MCIYQYLCYFSIVVICAIHVFVPGKQAHRIDGYYDTHRVVSTKKVENEKSIEFSEIEVVIVNAIVAQ